MGEARSAVSASFESFLKRKLFLCNSLKLEGFSR